MNNTWANTQANSTGSIGRPAQRQPRRVRRLPQHDLAALAPIGAAPKALPRQRRGQLRRAVRAQPFGHRGRNSMIGQHDALLKLSPAALAQFRVARSGKKRQCADRPIVWDMSRSRSRRISPLLNRKPQRSAQSGEMAHTRKPAPKNDFHGQCKVKRLETRSGSGACRTAGSSSKTTTPMSAP